jgi:protein-S-isoprenylcysteine O-methyltransferase Ste14
MREPADQAERDSPGVHVPPPLVYLGVFLVALLLERRFPSFEMPRAPARVAAVVCIVLWLTLSLPAILLFVHKQTGLIPSQPATILVTEGPYRRTRNPMYLGLIFLYLALSLWFGVTWGLALLPVVVLLIQVGVVLREEKYLERRFGEEYRGYRRRVRRWF